jgi:hypothetical protein
MWRPIYIFLSYHVHFFLEWEMFQAELVEKIKSHILYSVTFFSKIVLFMRYCGNILWNQRGYVVIWCMHIVCWVTKATNTHSDCVIFIAFPLQQWLHEHASMLHHTYIACLVSICLYWKTFMKYTSNWIECEELYLFYLDIFILSIRTQTVLHFNMITDLPTGIFLRMWLKRVFETTAENK